MAVLLADTLATESTNSITAAAGQTITVTTGHGARFSAAAGADRGHVLLVEPDDSKRELAAFTRSGDVLTLAERAVLPVGEFSTAQSFSSGATVVQVLTTSGLEYTTRNRSSSFQFDGDVAIAGTSPWADAKAYGAVGDGVTDDGPAIQAAIDAVSAEVIATVAVGGVVFLPKGVYLTNQQLKVKNRVTLRGMGKYATRVKAGGSFPVSTAVIRIGDGTSTVFNCRVEDIYVDCAAVAGSIGIHSTEANERSGAFGVGIAGFMDRGVHIDGSGGTAQNFTLEDIDPQADATSGSTTVAVHIQQCTGMNWISGVSAAAASPATLAVGLRVTNGSTVVAEHLHFERATAGVKYEGASVGVIHGVTGHSTVTSAVELASCPNVVVLMVDKNSGTNSVLDTGTAVTASIVHEYLSSGGKLVMVDVNLYRSAADILKTDDGLHVDGTLGIGTAPLTTQLIRVVKEITGNNMKGMEFIPSMRPNAAGSFAQGVAITPTLLGSEGSAVETIAELYGIAIRPTVGATYDANITNAFGIYVFQVADSGGGAIQHQYGYYTNISAGATNNWQFYGAGTAPSRLGGALGILADPGSAALRVAGQAHVDALRVGSSATSGHVLTADATGVATFQVVPSAPTFATFYKWGTD